MPGGAVFGFDTAAARRYVELINKLFGMESGDAPLPPGFILELERPEWAFLVPSATRSVAIGRAGDRVRAPGDALGDRTCTRDATQGRHSESWGAMQRS